MVLIVEKYIYDESNGLWYELQGDYYIPCLTVPVNEQPIGSWGQRHLRYISQYQKVRHTTLLLTGKLNSYLAELDARAVQMYDSLVTQMAAKEGVTELLKAQDQMTWVQRMNNIRNAAEEIVNTEVIFV